MPKKTDLKTSFTGTLNKDSDNINFPPEDYREALNITNGVGEEGRFNIVTNSEGTRQVPYSLPIGKSKVIGAYEDRSNQRVIYFLWNQTRSQIIEYDNNTGAITELAYSTPTQGIRAVFPWTEDSVISQIDLVDDKYLYWTDERPKSLDIAKSREDKKRTTALYFIGDEQNLWGNYYLNVYQDGVPVFPPNQGGPPPVLQNDYDGTRKDFLEKFLDRLNQIGNFTDYFTGEVCGDFLEVTAKNEGEWTIRLEPYQFAAFQNNVQVFEVPQNFYAKPLTYEHVTAGRWPLGCDPKVTYKLDRNINYNYVEGREFQFRTRLHFFDDSKSVLSPISDLPVNKRGCADNIFNYIEIDYTDDRLSSYRSMSIIREVEILVRETNDGRWRSVKRIPQNELWRESGDINQNIYNFYNDGIYPVIEEIEENHPYDALPIQSIDGKFTLSQEYFDNRIGYSNFIENYEKPCDDSDLDVEFTERDDKNVFTISSILRIYSFQLEGGGFAQEAIMGAIHNLGDGNGPVWGGASSDGVDDKTGIHYKQYLPEGGFPVYLAGTDYIGISEQVLISKPRALSQYNTGVIATSTSTQRNDLKYWYQDFSSSANHDQILSVSNIKNVLPGKYVVRVASHNCGYFGDGSIYDLFNAQAYQRTSTNVFGFFPNENGVYPDLDNDGSGYDRLRIHTDNNNGAGTQFDNGNGVPIPEITIEIFNNGTYQLSSPSGYLSPVLSADANNNIFIGDFLIQDLSYPQVNQNETVVAKTGYLYDNGGSSQNIEKGTGVEHSKLEIESYVTKNDRVTSKVNSFTDHNGYFFFQYIVNDGNVSGGGVGRNEFNTHGFEEIKAYQVTGGTASNIFTTPVVMPGTIEEMYSENKDLGEPLDYGIGLAQQEGTASVMTDWILAVANPDFSDICRTKIKGQILENNLPVPGISVVYERTGRTAVSDQNGDFSLLVYGDAQGGSSLASVGETSFGSLGDNWDKNQNKRIWDDLLFSKNGFCNVVINNQKFNDNPLNIDAFGQAPAYNDFDTNPNHFFVSDFIVFLFNERNKQLKNGGSYRFAYFFADELNRRCGLITNSGLEYYQPFITETADQVEPKQTNLPSVQADGKFDVHLKVNEKPPEWARWLYILRTRERNYNGYLQFVVNSVKYVEAYDSINDTIIETTFDTGTAEEIWLDLGESFRNYKFQNQSSTKAWQFRSGDRIRFIRNEKGELFNPEDGIVDIPINNVRDDEGKVDLYSIDNFFEFGEIKPGTLVEVYTPQKDLQEEFFYEIHSCVPINLTGTSQVHYDVSPSYVNDISGKAFSEAVKVQLNTGDTYPRNRRMPISPDDGGGGIFNYWIEDEHLSDFRESNEEDIGRTNAIDDTFGKIERTNAIRFGDQYIRDSKVNGLPTFRGANIEFTPPSYGALTSIVTTSDNNDREVLLGIHEKNTVSIYIGSVAFSDLEGQDIVALSSKVLPALRLLKGEYGSVNIESVFSNDGEVYWWDDTRGEYIRYSRNGLYPISQDKMKSEFAKYKGSGKVLTTYDRYYDRVYVIFQFSQQGEVVESTFLFSGIEVEDASEISEGDTVLVCDQDGLDCELTGVSGVDGNTIVVAGAFNLGEVVVKTKKTLSYSEPQKGWESFWSFQPEMVARLNDQLITFQEGQLYIHDDDANPNTFYGIQYPSQIRAVLANPSKKTFLGLKEIADTKWNLPEITTPPDSSYPIGMKSRLKPDNINVYEGDIWADFLRDINDPRFQNDLESLLRGRELKGTSIELLLETNAQKFVFLRMLEVFYSLSETTT